MVSRCTLGMEVLLELGQSLAGVSDVLKGRGRVVQWLSVPTFCNGTYATTEYLVHSLI